MVTKVQMMDVLVNAAPSFRPTWEAFLDDWREEVDDLALYAALGDYSSHLISMLERRIIA